MPLAKQYNEIERRAEDKLAAAIYRRNRQPLALLVELEHLAEMGLIRKQVETAFNKRK